MNANQKALEALREARAQLLFANELHGKDEDRAHAEKSCAEAIDLLEAEQAQAAQAVPAEPVCQYCHGSRLVEAAEDDPDLIVCPKCATPQPVAVPLTVPHPGGPEASAMIDSELAARGWPSNTKNAARAGYEACRKLIGAGIGAAAPKEQDHA
jgi:hypothetical protein